MVDLVLVDTCVWASFFGKPRSVERRVVDVLIDLDRVALVGPVVTEVLIGFRKKREADWIASRLKAAHEVIVSWEDWQGAANLGRSLGAQGHKLPVTDLVIAAVCLRLDLEVYTTDPHFDLVAGLRRFKP